MQPIPNLATESTPAAFVFGYMFPNAQQDHIIKRYWPEGSYKDVQPVGPSPVLIHREQLRKIYRKWLDFSLGLRSNGDAEKVIQGWVQEMWGYSIAAASVGVKHRLVEEFQVEPGALSTADQLKDFGKRHYIFHYTYQFEYMSPYPYKYMYQYPYEYMYQYQYGYMYWYQYQYQISTICHFWSVLGTH